MPTRFLEVLILLIVSHIANAQFSLSVGGGLDHSFASSPDIGDTILHKFYPRSEIIPQLNAEYDYKKFCLTVSESYFIWGYDSGDISFTDVSGNDLGTGKLFINNFSLLSGISLGYCFGKKFSITPQIGIGGLWVFDERYKTTGFEANGILITGLESHAYENFIWMVSGNVQLKYRICDHLEIFNLDSYQRSISNVLNQPPSQYDYALNNLQFTVGISFTLRKKKTK